MPTASPPSLAAADVVRHRLTSGLLDGLSQWWQGPALVVVAAAVVALVAWSYRRDAAELPAGLRALLVTLRLGAFAALALAALDLERSSELEVVVPSRVAVLVDTSASMALADDDGDGPEADRPTRARQALDVLDGGGLVAALAARHEVALWRFDAAAERIAVLPNDGLAPWRERVVADGSETRLGDALTELVEREPSGSLAGVVIVSDGAGNAGADPRAAAAALAAARVPVLAIGAGADAAPANLRVADLAAPARVFPGDRFTVTAYLQTQGLEGTRVRIDLAEAPADGGVPRSLEVRDALAGSDGELVAVRFDLPGFAAPGRHTLVVRAAAPAADRLPADDVRSADVEVVDRVTRVLVMAGGPGREFQFLRGVLERDESFSVDVLLGTAGGAAPPGNAAAAPPGGGQIGGFPASDEALGEYDAIVACDWDWRRLDAAALARLERWVALESGGLLLMAGGVAMGGWLGDPGMEAVRGLFPVELRRPNQPPFEPGARAEPMPLRFTRDGLDAEFLWLAGTRAESELAWSAFPGFHACHEAGAPKPGATVYARAGRGGSGRPGDDDPVALAGQFFGSGTVAYVGSAELWRLRGVDPVLHERVVTQLVRHVAQARLLRGSRRGRLLVDRDRVPLGGGIGVRLVLPAGAASPRCRAVAPDGTALPVTLVAEPGRPEVLRGTAPAAQQGTWRIEVDAGGPAADEPLVRRVQVELPDRELAQPRLQRAALEEIAAVTGGRARFLHDAAWTSAEAAAFAALLPDRTRLEYEAGADDAVFKRRLNTALLAFGVGCLCVEWLLRRLAKLA